MAHTSSRVSGRRRRSELLLGTVAIVAGVGLLVVMVLALQHPRGQTPAPAKGNTASSSVPATGPARSSTPAKSTPRASAIGSPTG